jgi:hypothetical protein
VFKQQSNTVKRFYKSISTKTVDLKTPFISSRQISAHQVIEFAQGPAAEGEALKIRRPLQRVHGVF